MLNIPKIRKKVHILEFDLLRKNIIKIQIFLAQKI